MAKLHKKQHFRKPQLQIDSYNHSLTKGRIEIRVGKLVLGNFLFSFAEYNTPAKEIALLEKIASMFKQTIESGKPLVENLNTQEL